jgi:hypothetical protein
MHGLLVEVNIEAGREDEAADYLNSQVVSRVREAPGFVAGYWWNSSSGEGWGLTVFDSEGSAKQAAEMAASGQIVMPDYVSMGSQEVVEIRAHA